MVHYSHAQSHRKAVESGIQGIFRALSALEHECDQLRSRVSTLEADLNRERTNHDRTRRLLGQRTASLLNTYDRLNRMALRKP